MTKIASKLVTGIAILGLAAPAFAATSHAHRRVAQAETKQTPQKKVVKKHKGHAKQGTSAQAPAPAPTPAAPAAPAATPAPAK